jgi:hypothetical protein
MCHQQKQLRNEIRCFAIESVHLTSARPYDMNKCMSKQIRSPSDLHTLKRSALSDNLHIELSFGKSLAHYFSLDSG